MNNRYADAIGEGGVILSNSCYMGYKASYQIKSRKGSNRLSSDRNLCKWRMGERTQEAQLPHRYTINRGGEGIKKTWERRLKLKTKKE